MAEELPVSEIQSEAAVETQASSSPDNIDEFFNDIVAPQGMFGDAKEFREFIVDPKNAKEFYNDVIVPGKMFSSEKEYNDYIGISGLGKTGPGLDSASNSGTQGAPTESGSGQLHTIPEPPQRGDRKIWAQKIPANFDEPKARRMASELGFSEKDLTSDDLSYIVDFSKGRSVGEAAAMAKQIVQKRRSENGPEKPAAKAAVESLVPTTPATFQKEEEVDLGLGGVSKKIGSPTQAGTFQNYEKDQRFFAKVSEAKREIVDKKNNDFALPQDEEGMLVYKYATNPKLYAEAEKKSDAARSKFTTVLTAKINDDLSGAKWKEFADGGVVSLVKIDEYAKKLARDNGVEDDGFAKKYIASQVESAVAMKALKPRVDEIYEREKPRIIAEIGKRSSEFTDKNLKGSEHGLKIAEITAATEFQIKSTLSEINELSKADAAGLDKEYTPRIKMAQDAWKAAESEIIAAAEQVNQQVIQGKIPPEEGKAQIDQMNAMMTQEHEAHSKDLIALNAEYQSRMNAINAKHQSRFNRQQDEFRKSANDKISAEYQQWREKSGIDEKTASMFEREYRKIFNDVITQHGKDKAAAQNASLDLISQAIKMPRPVAAYAMTTTSSLGGSLAALGTSLGLDGMELTGKIMEQRFELPAAKTDSWTDLFNPENLSKLTGQLTGSMLPGIVASAAAARTGAGQGLAAELVLGGLAGWWIETMDISWRMYTETLESTGSEAEAQKRASEIFDTQVKIIPLYAFEALPFVSKLPAMFGKKTITRAAVKGGVEYVTELSQELPQNIFEKGIAAGRNPYSELKDFAMQLSAGDEGAWKQFKSTAISIAPTIIFGAGGEIKTAVNESSKKADEAYLGKREVVETADALGAKFDFCSSTPEALGQQVFRIAQDKGPSFATATISSMFTSGYIDEATRDRMIESVQKSKVYGENAKKASMTDSEARTYVALSEYHEAAQRKADEEPDELLKAAFQKKANRYKTMLTDFVDSRSIEMISVEFIDGTEVLMPGEEIVTKFKNDQQFRDDFAAGLAVIKAYGETTGAQMDEIKKIIEGEKAQAQEATTEEAAPVDKPAKTLEDDLEIGDTVDLTPKAKAEAAPQAPVAEAAKAEESTLPPEIDTLNDNEIVSITYERFDEIPDSLKDKANKIGGHELKVRKSILGIPVGKETSVKTKEGYVVSVPGSEIKEAARLAEKAKKDVESTKNALDDIMLTDRFSDFVRSSLPYNGPIQSNKDLSEAYHKAKADGSNPELVQAVEELLAPKTESTPSNKPSNTTENGKQEASTKESGTKSEDNDAGKETRGESGNENDSKGQESQGNEGGQEVNVKNEGELLNAPSKAATLFEDLDATTLPRTIVARTAAKNDLQAKYGPMAEVAKGITTKFASIAKELKQAGIFTDIKC